MIDPITAAAATKAYAGVKAFIEAGKSIEDTFQVVARWQGHASDVLTQAKGTRSAPAIKASCVCFFSRSGSG